MVVREVAPVLQVASPTLQPVPEGSPFTLSLTSIDPGADTIQRWVIDWSDGTIDTLTGAAVVATHSFGDQGSRLVLVSATDEDGSYGTSALVQVVNVAPGVTGLAFGSPVFEGDVASLSGLISEPGILDRVSLDVDWGDNGAVETFTFVPGASVFELTHRYLDNSSPGPCSPSP